MTKREEYEQKTEALLLPILDEHQFELVDVEYVKEGENWFLRAYIDKPENFSCMQNLSFSIWILYY